MGPASMMRSWRHNVGFKCGQGHPLAVFWRAPHETRGPPVLYWQPWSPVSTRAGAPNPVPLLSLPEGGSGPHGWDQPWEPGGSRGLVPLRWRAPKVGTDSPRRTERSQQLPTGPGRKHGSEQREDARTQQPTRALVTVAPTVPWSEPSWRSAAGAARLPQACAPDSASLRQNPEVRAARQQGRAGRPAVLGAPGGRPHPGPGPARDTDTPAPLPPAVRTHPTLRACTADAPHTTWLARGVVTAGLWRGAGCTPSWTPRAPQARPVPTALVFRWSLCA